LYRKRVTDQTYIARSSAPSLIRLSEANGPRKSDIQLSETIETILTASILRSRGEPENLRGETKKLSLQRADGIDARGAPGGQETGDERDDCQDDEGGTECDRIARADFYDNKIITALFGLDWLNQSS
jgi:hypothetical protein